MPTPSGRHRVVQAPTQTQAREDHTPARRGRQKLFFGGANSGVQAGPVAAALPSELTGNTEVQLHQDAPGVHIDIDGFYPTTLPFANPLEEQVVEIDDSVVFNPLGADGPLRKAAHEVKQELRDADGVVISPPCARYEIESAPPPNGAARLLVDQDSGRFLTQDQLFLVQMPPVLPVSGTSPAKRAYDARQRQMTSLRTVNQNIATESTNDLSAMRGKSLFASQAPGKEEITNKESVELPPSENPASALPTGLIGKLRVHQSGRLTMLIGDVIYEVTPGVTPAIHQQLVSVDTTTATANALSSVTRKIVLFPNPESLLFSAQEQYQTTRVIMGGQRPENQGPPDVVCLLVHQRKFYNADEAAHYATSTRMRQVQAELAERCLELIALPEGEGKLLLDVGCGTGSSGAVLTENGYNWVGVDISSDMLSFLDGDADAIRLDMGQGLPMRAGLFDGCISVSALQWLCYSNATNEVPMRRLRTFFATLFTSLCRGARAALQFYPESPAQIEMIVAAALKSGFHGGIVTDYPHSAKARKHYLVLTTAPTSHSLPAPRLDENSEAQVVTSRERQNRNIRRGKPARGSREWILQKKENERRAGKAVRNDSRYTGRKRKDRL